VRVGTSSRDLPLRATVTIEGPPADQGPVLDRYSTIDQWLQDPQGRPVIQPLLKKMMGAMGGGNGGGEQPGMSEIFGSLPLTALPSLSGGALTENRIDQLVQQVRADQEGGDPPEQHP
jgi:beta-glucosidase